MSNYNDVKNLWQQVLKFLESEFTEVVFNTWIKTLIPTDIKNNCLILKTEQIFFKTTIEQRYLNTIINAIQSVSNYDMTAKIITADESMLENSNTGILSNNSLNPKYVFENFVRGKSNELAYAAAVAIAEAPGNTSYNPLFLYGGVGLGKTHLMHSIGNYIINKSPEAKIIYISTESFTNELISSIRERKNQEFRNKYRDIDVLLVDDIQFLSNKEGTQEEFFHTFNTLYEANKQIVISSDQPPKQINSLEERLTSRFGCGLIVDITLPDFETRCAIIEKKAEIDNIEIPYDVTEFIAKNFSSNIRNLEGALNKVSAYSKLTKTKISLDLTEKILKDLINQTKKTDITIESVQQIVSKYYDISVSDMLGKRRTKNISYPRQIAMYLARKLINISLPKIGEKFGGRDHTTVIHACDKIFHDVNFNKDLQNILDNLEKKIKNS